MRVLACLAMGLAAGFCLAQGGGKLLVVEKGAGSLGIVDLGTGAVVSVPEGGVTGHEVAASADGRLAYVPIYGNSGVGKPGTDGREMVVVDVAAGKVVRRMDFGRGVRPHLPLLGPPVTGFPSGLLYVTTELEEAVTVVDPARLNILGQVPTGSAESHMLAVSHDGRRGYTANVGPGTVSVLDLVGRKLVTVIPVGKPGQAIPVQRISISEDDRLVFTSEQTTGPGAKPELDVIDTGTNAVVKRVPLESAGYGSAATPDGRWLVVAMPGVNKVAVVDLKTLEVARTVGVEATPQAVLVRPDGRFAYVSCDASGTVDEIDLAGVPASWKVTRRIAVGKMTDGMAWARGRE